LGATKGFNYKTGDWAKQVRRNAIYSMQIRLLFIRLTLMYKLSEITNGQGVNVIIDPIGKNYFSQNIDSMAVDGHMVIIAFMSGKLTQRCLLSLSQISVALLKVFLNMLSTGNIVEKLDLGPILRKRLRVRKLFDVNLLSQYHCFFQLVLIPPVL
jgi:threonine dehydrogenase-like Zn-dependent dehydrogenase